MKGNGGDICEVRGVIEPQINFVVQMPQQGWTQRLLQIGCGGLCGRMPDEYTQTSGCVPLEKGKFVVAMTLRLQCALSQGIHEEDRTTLLCQVGLLLERIAKLKAKQRFRR
jgi:hypothetical protein